MKLVLAAPWLLRRAAMRQRRKKRVNWLIAYDSGRIKTTAALHRRLGGEIRSESLRKTGSRSEGCGIERGTGRDLPRISRFTSGRESGECSWPKAEAASHDGGSEGGSVEADEGVLGGEATFQVTEADVVPYRTS